MVIQSPQINAEVESMIKIHLSKILGEKRWSQAELSRKTGIGKNAISEIYNEFSERINLDYLDLICEALDCNVEDILEYVPNKKHRTGDYLIKEVRRRNDKKH
jgi:putative transcriptional regulator